jgi:hypothetical protein
LSHLPAKALNYRNRQMEISSRPWWISMVQKQFYQWPGLDEVVIGVFTTLRAFITVNQHFEIKCETYGDESILGHNQTTSII